MGGAKAAWMDRQDDVQLPPSYLVHVGQLESCEIHGERWADGFELDSDFYRQAMADKNRGAQGPSPGRRTWARGSSPTFQEGLRGQLRRRLQLL